MKKVLASIIVLIYLVISTGFIVSLHFCMDRFDSAELGSSSSNKCNKCGMHKDGRCCHDVVKVIKLQTSHLSPQVINPFFKTPVAQIISTEFFTVPFRNYTGTIPSIDHGPPLPSERDLYLQNGVFRI